MCYETKNRYRQEYAEQSKVRFRQRNRQRIEKSSLVVATRNHLLPWRGEHVSLFLTFFALHGVVALGVLEPEKVHGHEKTLKGPKEDRLKLMRATEANFARSTMSSWMSNQL